MKGNYSNHKRIYARKEDLDRIENKLDKFLNNDWKHLSIRVWILVGMMAVLIPLVICLVK